MKIIEKLSAKNMDKHGQQSAVMAFLGDSVTHGCFELFFDANDKMDTVCETRNSYSSLLKEKFEQFYPYASPIVINAGISGGNAPEGAARLERDVLRFSPDITVVCFGLNDCQGGKEGLVRYSEALKSIFTRLSDAGGEVIFMTPNMMNTEVSRDITDDRIKKIAESIMNIQNNGGMDEYMQAAVKTAKQCNVTVCDCYAKWKQLEKSGVNVTSLLSNRINHPTREMHRLFSNMLFDTMMGE